MNRKNSLVSLLYVLLGAAGAYLYALLFQDHLDADGLLIRGTLPEIILWMLTAAALLSAVVVSRKTGMGKVNRYVSAVGSLAFAAGVYTLVLTEPKGPEVLCLIYQGTIWAAVAALLLSAVLEILGQKPFFLLDVVACILCLLHMVECYQLWSEKPVLLDYFFGVGAVLLLMMFSYEKMAHRAQLPQKALFRFSGLAGIFFCCTAGMQGEFSMFFVSGAVWMLAEMTALCSAGE